LLLYDKFIFHTYCDVIILLSSGVKDDERERKRHQKHKYEKEYSRSEEQGWRVFRASRGEAKAVSRT